ncbi:pantothenate synthetase [Desulfobaculum bizertense DSM 18034]|uniref:Pantothenate synthetase n=2 Tax=Desulfobaculum TaxID=1433996 RepID=A0A1T4WB03_9BACT|nr:pantothenate synthetase [Desulfobaculum bizertense DSM 18034]
MLKSKRKEDEKKMEIVTDPQEFQKRAFADRAAGLKTALVPTMGFLHEGHKSLMEYARQNADRVYASVFVNPTQFGPTEDLEDYPRDLEHDAQLAESAGVDILFVPEARKIYAANHAAWVEVPQLAEHLCGQSRPIHFRGVATVVSILLHLAMPSIAIFGEKDWQQQAILRRMVRDLWIPTEIVARPIVREADGLAKSSRNLYLTESERKQAPGLHAGLLHLAKKAKNGERDVAELRKELEKYFAEHVPAGKIDYIEFVNPEEIQPVTRLEGPTLVAIAVALGKARLIDNQLLLGED